MQSLLGIREFGQQKFMGNYLSVSRAKESFLDRLKRERENNSIGSKLLELSMATSSEVKIEKPKPQMTLPVIQKEVSSDEESSEEEEEELPPPRPTSTTQSFQKTSAPKLDQATIDDMKRQESLKKLKELHKEKQNAIRNALSSIDSGVPLNNKIVFEKPEPPQVQEKSKNLFDDEEEDEEEEPSGSFKLKKQFEGKKGEKLFELQTRFQGDKRFVIDEKFAEGSDDVIDSRKRYTREELKERKKFRREMQDWDKNELKEEHDHQLSILQSITGEATAMSDKFNSSKFTQKGMLRFDPSKKSHQKYLDVVNADEEMEIEHENHQIESGDENKKVDDEKFYQVSNNLTEAFQLSSEKNKPFSILSMLGIEHENERKVEGVEQIKTLNNTNNKAFQFNQIRFKYESSDSEEEKTAPTAVTSKKKSKAPQKQSKFGKFSKNGVFHYNFFYRDDDVRLKEGFKFLLKSEPIAPEVLQEKRQKLKLVVKNSIRKAKKDKNKRKPISKKRKVK